MDGSDLLEALARSGAGRGELVALVLAPNVGLGLATSAGRWAITTEDPRPAVQAVEDAVRPRWVMWSNETAASLVQGGVRVAMAWDVAAVHRLLFGGWAADPAYAWARLHDLGTDDMPTVRPDLFSRHEDEGGDPDDPVRPDGHLRAEWLAGGWRANVGRLGAWAALAHSAATIQQARLAAMADRPMALPTARSESAAELLCAEMAFDGLPMDRAVAEQIIAGYVGPRPHSEAEAAAERARRDAEVLRHVAPGVEVDLRSTRQVRALLSRLGVELPDTRAWRLREVRDQHPVVGALLAWRKAERVATTYGYAWLDQHMGADGRLRGTWSGSDGAAGRMTATGGVNTMPADLRPAVVAEAGHVFARADLGQVEPRVLAVVSGDEALGKATLEDDLYAPVAAQLGVDRPTAKLAVLGAMYGQTTGHGAQALRRLGSAYPVAMAYLERAADEARAGHDLRTYGGRLVRMGRVGTGGPGAPEERAVTAARGRYGRNAVVQGAAAELFKVWAVTVRARCQHLEARIVLCLHDELLVHTPVEQSEAVERLLGDCLDEAVQRWAPGVAVRFVADISVVRRWSDAKGSSGESVGTPEDLPSRRFTGAEG